MGTFTPLMANSYEAQKAWEDEAAVLGVKLPSFSPFVHITGCDKCRAYRNAVRAARERLDKAERDAVKAADFEINYETSRLCGDGSCFICYGAPPIVIFTPQSWSFDPGSVEVKVDGEFKPAAPLRATDFDDLDTLVRLYIKLHESVGTTALTNSIQSSALKVAARIEANS